MKKFFFNLRYWRNNAPWDSGVSPPELLDFIEQHPAGRAIDLGCGTGTNVITLAQHGWEATGVDFAPRAIRIAKRKARKAKVKVDLRVGDVTELHDIQGQFDFALDMGCFHNMGAQKQAYLDRLDTLLAPGGYWLLYAHLVSEESPDSSHALLPEDVEGLAARFQLVSRTDTLDSVGRNSIWALFQKKPLNRS